MTGIDDLVGRTVKYKCPDKGFIRYGVLSATGRRMRSDIPKLTRTGKRVKRPTTGCVIIEMHNGISQRVPEENIHAWVYYGVERPMDWRPEANQGA